MDDIWRLKKYITLLLCVVKLSPGSPENVSAEFADLVGGQRKPPSWYDASVDAEQKRNSSYSHSRWRTQMAPSQTVYSFQVKEDTLPGTVVGKVEARSETLTPITYSIQEDDGDNLFLLSPVSGEFLLSRSLDFETQSFYILTVELQQGDSRGSSVRVYFNVLDVNDNPPLFSQEDMFASLCEDTLVGTCFLLLDVSDKDYGENGKVELKIVSGDKLSMFFIHSSGHLCLNKDLDRERQSSFNLTVTANDCAQPASFQHTSTAHVAILVEDVNDNAPIFLSAKSVTVPEDTVLHSVIMTVHAEDEDADSNAQVLYFLSNSSGGMFSINSTSGNIYLEEKLDRETVDIFTIAVVATDMGLPQRSSIMNLTVHVGDVNDNGPKFLQSNYSLAVREDIPRGTSLFQFKAHDPDIGPNGQIRYSLTPVGLFLVDAVRGVISVMDRLDRERESNYSLIIAASDQGNTPRSDTAVVSITVLDVNDFTPQFSPEILIIHVKENDEEPSQLTHQVSALDDDFGINSQLMYFLHNGNSDGLFSVTPDGTLQILRSLDKENESLYVVTITAVDSGFPPLTGTLTVQVIVEDVNDNHPEFPEEVYTTIVSEDSPIGTVFAMISALDADEGSGGEVRYSIENLHTPFAIVESSGELFTTDFLDRETVAIYTVTVVGSDMHPTQPLTSSVLVTVLVGDVNDHWPQFMDSPYVAYIPAGLEPGSVIFALKATDEDIDMNAMLHYSFYGQSSYLFSIDPQSGKVFTSSLLPDSDDIIINAYVEDAGETPKFDVTTISIRFRNISHFPEMNVDVVNYSLSEDEPAGAVVAAVSATSNRAESVSFFLASGNLDNTFRLDQLHGMLTVEHPLDYENNKQFSLLVEARDSGSPPFSSFAEIHINISDVNDNVPQFTQAEYRCEVFENSPPSAVCDVLAIDADSPDYSIIEYNITEGNQDNFFIIDPVNGLLSTVKSLDRENIAEFILTVEAVELDNPLHRDRATVVITVLDRNDNAPRFVEIFFKEVPEDASIGHTVMQVVSIDDDTFANAVVSYCIPAQRPDLPFDIDSITGHITIKMPLDRESQDHYLFKVNANDSAWSVSTDISIFVADVNDNRPVFSNSAYKTVLPETNKTEVFVLQVLAMDADVGPNSEIFYVVEPQNDLFFVDYITGEIYTKQPLVINNSTFKIWDFTVIAFDNGNTPLYSNATVTVRLEQVNRHPPVFTIVPAMIAIPYDLFVGTEVFMFTATDLDANNASEIDYIVNGGNAFDFFQVSSDTGQVLLNQTLLESKNLSLTLSVIAKDHGFPPLTSQTEITFEITGRNQHSPSFDEPFVTFSVPEDLPVGSVAGKIQAEDEDYGLNGVITYSISPENKHLPFSVGEFSGLLTLTGQLDFETENIYHLQIKATDAAWISKTAVLNVTVIVVDVNDNPPLFSAAEYAKDVHENSKIGTIILDMKATDIDSGINAQITYSLIAGNVDKFGIDSRNGTITTLEVFDYEQEQRFDLTIKASNSGRHSLFTLAYVTINILDVNEFTPAFLKENFHFSVFKNVPLTTMIGKVTATDNDRGSEGQVFYLMFGRGKNSDFGIDKLTGEIYTNRSLRNQGNSHVVFKVLAKNSGIITGLNEDESFVHISIIDINDAPMFLSTLYEVNVTEDTPPGTSVLTVRAIDQDSLLDWSHLFFSIEKGNTNSSFSIDPLSGVISVDRPLDRELWPVYNLTAIVTDTGSPPATGATTVVVFIGDINDNAPQLTMTEAHVMENQPEGTLVIKLSATDLDSPPNQGPFTFKFSNNLLLDNPFQLNPDGVLLTTESIDREKVPEYRLLVTVTDNGSPLPLSSTATLHIKVVDENDNHPLPRNIFIEVKYFGSSFKGGMIGSVHPEDPDESDTFICAIKSGPINMFIIANGTCELWSSPFQGEATFNVTVEATDHFHFPVNNSIYINYKGFTNTSVDSCILFYVSVMSMEEFLSKKYLRFVKALDSLFNLQASKTHVFGIKDFGNEVLLLAAVKNYNGQYLSGAVASSISAGHKKLLETQSNVTISHITSDPCLPGPCQNGASCNKNIYISQEVKVLESTAVIFVAPQKEILNCTCLVGFTGSLCEDDIDECEVNPCENNGTCENTAGSFHCHCQNGFSGSFCSADVDECLRVKCQNGGTCIHTRYGYYCQCTPGYEGERCEDLVDHCRSSPCVQGRCMNSQTGFFCNCPFGVSGVHCEEQSFGFEELSFVEFPSLDRTTNLIAFEFATLQKNSLLLFNPGTSASREFLALEIVNGNVHLSYDLGSGPVKLQTNKQVADGFFHSVSVRRFGNMGSLVVDNCTAMMNNGFCFSKDDGKHSERTLDVGSSNLTFGGVRNFDILSQHHNQIKTHDFIGCVRKIHINGILLKPSMGLAMHNIMDRCPRAATGCNSVPCKNGGVCHDLWSDYLCECRNPFTGRNCTTEMSEELALKFDGHDNIEYTVKEKFKRDYLLQIMEKNVKKENTTDPTPITIKFRTKDDGLLLFILGQKGHITLMIRDGKPLCIFKDAPSGRLSEISVASLVADGVWHKLSLFSSDQTTFLLLDDRTVSSSSKGGVNLTPDNVDKIIFGAAPHLRLSGFIGCVQYVTVAGFTLPVSGHSLMMEVRLSSTLPQSSCKTPSVCLPSSCSNQEPFKICNPALQNFSCICLQNVSDHVCDICSSETHEKCFEVQRSNRLWLIGVFLPLISMLVLVGVCVGLYILKRDTMCENECLSKRKDQGRVNKNFCFDDTSLRTDVMSTKKQKPEIPTSTNQQISNESFYSDPNLSCEQPILPSELQYYEIKSICSTFKCENTSPKSSCSNYLHGYSDSKKHWGDLRRLLGKFRKENCSGEKNSAKHPNVTLLKRLSPDKQETEQPPEPQPRYMKTFPQAALLEQIQSLSFEEIRKLHSPLEPNTSHQAPPKFGPTETSSDCDTDSTFTCSESEYGLLSVINGKKDIHESRMQEDFLPCNKTSPFSASQHHTERDPSAVIQQWANVLNQNLPFSSYAPIFKDIADLPNDSLNICDAQSDVEEII